MANKYTTRLSTTAPRTGGLISMPGVRSTNPWVQAQIEAAQKKREEEEREAARLAAERAAQEKAAEAVVPQRKTTNTGVQKAMAGLGKAPEVTPADARLRSTNPLVQAALDDKYAREDAAYAEWDSQRKARQAARAEEVKRAGGIYATLPQNADFTALSAARGDVYDPTYRYINNADNYRESAEGKRNLTNDRKKLQYMTADEVKTYNYLYNKDASGFGQRLSRDYLDSLSNELDRRQAKDEAEKNRAYAEAHPIAASAASVTNSVIGGVASTVDLGLQAAKKMVTGEDINYNSRYQQYGNRAEDIRGMVSENIDSPVGRFLYDTGMSAADSLAAGALGPVGGGAALGMSAGASAARDAASRGASDGQALVQGLAAGVFEGLFEKVSIGELKALKDVPVTGVKTVVTNMLKSAGVNATEEALTEVANEITDRINMGELSNYRTSVDAYMAQGMSETEAKKKAARDAAGRIGMAALSGAAMGTAFGGIDSAQSGVENAMTGAAINRAGDAQSVLDEGGAQVRGTDARRLADQLAEKQAGGAKLRNAEIGALARETARQEEADRDVLGNDLPKFSEASAGTRATAAALKRAGKAMGRDVYFYRDEPEVGGYAEGGAVWLNLEASDPMAKVFAHELTHTSESAAIYDELRSLALSTMSEKELASAKEKKKETYKTFAWKTGRVGQVLDDAGAEAEVVADYAARKLFSDEEAVAWLARRNQHAALRVYDRVRGWAATARGDEERAFLGRAQRLYAQALRQSRGTQRGERQERIGRTINNVPFVTVERDILDGVPESEWTRTVKENLGERFPNGITVNGQHIKINSKTKNEITGSKYTKTIRNNENDVYADKMRATDNADEIVDAAQNWVGERPKHKRKDSIKEFARGQVLLRIGNADYIADVDVGTTADGSALLYDIVNMRKTGIKEKNPARTGQVPSSQVLDSDRYDVAAMLRRNETRHRTNISAFDNSIPKTNANDNTGEEIVTETSQSGRRYSIAEGDDLAKRNQATEDLLQYAEEVAEAAAVESENDSDGWYGENSDRDTAAEGFQGAADNVDNILPSEEEAREILRSAAEQQRRIEAEDSRRRQTEKQISVAAEREKKPIGDRAREARSYIIRKIVDSGEAVGRLGKAMGDRVLYHYYNMARSSPNAAISMITDAQTDVQGRKVGESLESIFKPIRDKGGDYYTKFQLYMYHLHNIDRMSFLSRATPSIQAAQAEINKFRASFPQFDVMTDQQIHRLAKEGSGTDADLAGLYIQLQRALHEVSDVENKPVFGYDVDAEESRNEAERLFRENPEFQQLAEKVYRYNDNLMQYRIDSGLVDKRFAEQLKALYPHYVPTFRMQDEAAVQQRRQNQVQIGKTIGRAEGSAKRLKPLHKAMEEQTLSVVREGSKNRFALRLIADLERYGTAERGKRDARTLMEALSNAPSELQHEILGIEEAGGGLRVDTFDDTALDRADLITNTVVIRDGDRRWKLTVNPALYEAFHVLNPDIKEANVVTKMVRGMNDLYKKFITGLNPFFAVKNFLRDLQDAGLYTGNVAQFAKKYPQAWKEIGTNGEAWQQYKALGGTYSSVFDYETGTLKNEPEWKKKTIGRVSAANMAIEQAPRLAEFMATRDRLMKQKGEAEASMDTLMEAMYAAADITTNFGRSGTWGKMLNQNYIPFLNPGIQGFDKLVRTISGEKTAQEWARLAAHAAVIGIVPAVINALIWGDDEEWDELNSRDKDVYYLFKVGEGTWLKLPKGRAASLFGMAVNIAADAIRGNSLDLKERAGTAISQVAPANPLEENILKAWFDADLFDPDSPGKTWYGGDIEPQRLRDLAPGERYDEKTDELSKLIGKITGLSPKKINYLLDSYSGVVGDVVLPLLTPRAEQNPMFAAFTLNSRASNRLNNDFYTTLDELTYAKNRPGASGLDTVIYRYWNKQASVAADINQAIREIEADADLSEKEKRELVSAQYDVRNAMQREAKATLDKYRESAGYWYSRATGDEDDRIDYAYRMANKEIFGAEYALKTYNKATYEKAQRLNAEGVSYDHYFYMQFAAKEAAAAAEIESNELRSRIMDLRASEEEKKALYRGFVSTTRDDDIAALEKAGLSFDDFLRVQNAYTEINEKYSGAGDKQNAFARWLRVQKLSTAQKNAINNSFTYYWSIPAKESGGKNGGLTLPTLPQISLPEIKMPSLPQISLPGFGR